jgi:hypothetical protein
MTAILLVFYFTQGRIGNASDDAGNVYQTDDSTEVTISAATQSDKGNLSVTLTVVRAA